MTTTKNMFQQARDQAYRRGYEDAQELRSMAVAAGEQALTRDDVKRMTPEQILARKSEVDAVMERGL